MSKEKETEVPLIAPEIQAEHVTLLEDMEKFLYKENGIMEQLQQELSKKGYKVHILIVAYAKDDVHMKIILTDREATESEQAKVKSIFYQLVEKNKLDSSAFTLKVNDSDDGPDW